MIPTAVVSKSNWPNSLKGDKPDNKCNRNNERQEEEQRHGQKQYTPTALRSDLFYDFYSHPNVSTYEHVFIFVK